jgi:hypothetical protein
MGCGAVPPKLSGGGSVVGALHRRARNAAPNALFIGCFYWLLMALCATGRHPRDRAAGAGSYRCPTVRSRSQLHRGSSMPLAIQPGASEGLSRTPTSNHDRFGTLRVFHRSTRRAPPKCQRDACGEQLPIGIGMLLESKLPAERIERTMQGGRSPPPPPLDRFTGGGDGRE